MVGVPLLGVLLVLHAGEGLSAPTAIHGTWRVRTMDLPAAAARCLAGITPDSMHTMVLSQSGPEVTVAIRSADQSDWADATVRIAGAAASGTLAGGAVSDCAGPVRLSLTFGSRPVADSLFGTVADPACATCALLTFVATRRARTR